MKHLYHGATDESIREELSKRVAAGIALLKKRVPESYQSVFKEVVST